MHHWALCVASCFFLGIEVLCLLLGNTLVVVAGAGKDNILALSKVYTLWHNLGIEDNVGNKVGALCLLYKPLAAEAWHKLVATVVMVDTAAEPQALEILLESLKVLTLTVAVVMQVEVFHHLAYLKIMTSVLVEKYVTSPEGCFLKIIDECLLLKCQAVEAFHLISEHLYVGKSLIVILKLCVLLLVVA